MRQLIKRQVTSRVTMIGDYIAGTRAGVGFSPSDLFASGEQGAWYDPSDLTTMFQDSAGTTPVTADGQPVGKILDKSGRGNHATASADAKRPLYKTSGGLHWLQFDGVDDALATASINFTATNKISSFNGVRKASDADNGAFIELSADRNNTPGSFGVMIPEDATAAVSVGWRGTGSANGGYILKAGWPAPVTGVVTGLIDLSGATREDVGKIRIDAVQKTLTYYTSAAGGGNFSSNPLYIGARAGTSIHFEGNIYSMTILGRLATTQEITDTEEWVAAKTGVVLP